MDNKIIDLRNDSSFFLNIMLDSKLLNFNKKKTLSIIV